MSNAWSGFKVSFNETHELGEQAAEGPVFKVQVKARKRETLRLADARESMAATQKQRSALLGRECSNEPSKLRERPDLLNQCWQVNLAPGLTIKRHALEGGFRLKRALNAWRPPITRTVLLHSFNDYRVFTRGE